MPKISIVTIVLNDVSHIEKTMLSVLNQTYKDFEYIVIDGGSTDGTVEIIKKYDDKLSYWVSEKDRGIFDAMNKGAEHASGEWINFMNSGDYFYDEKVFENIFSKEYSGAGMLYGSFVGLVSGQEVLSEAFDNAYDHAWKGMRLGHQTLFAKTELMKKYKFDTSFKISADGDFVAKCISNGVKFQKVPIIIYRVGTLGASNSNWLTARKENWRIARKYFPGFRTDLFYFYGFAYDLGFRFIRKITPVFIYNFFRDIYRKTIKPGLIKRKYRYTVIERK